MHKKSLVSLFTFLFLFIFSASLKAQYEQSYSSAEILHDMQKLQYNARVLYLAAHPDDENTRFISYLVNDKKFETAYLALTRGDGGQNVIGSELREGLGLIRTQELLAARRTDGGKQFFTRANDFGYSKNPTETFNIWDREAVLSDIVWVIRNFQPDVIITRFNETPGITHGHHTASAILAHEAFKAAADKDRFTEQLAFVNPWETKQLFWNTSSWFFRGDQDFDESKYIKVDVGGYNAVLGESYTEIAAKSRSNHKSQAFGSSGTRGSEIELFEQWEGKKAEKDLFENIEPSWKRYKEGHVISKMVTDLLANFDAQSPASSIPALLEIRTKVSMLNESADKKSKLQLINELILKSAGFYHLASTSQFYGSPKDTLDLHLELVNRAQVPISVKRIVGNGFKLESLNLGKLQKNDKYEHDYKVLINAEVPYSTPYWLQKDASLGMYTVEDQQQRGQAENKDALSLMIELELGGQLFTVSSPVVYKANDRIEGEVIEPFYITPPITINFSEDVLIFTKPGQVRTIEVNVKALQNDMIGSIELQTPEGWEIIGDNLIAFDTLKRNEVYSNHFKIKSGTTFDQYTLKAVVHLNNGDLIDDHVTEIKYDHIPNQVIISKVTSALVFADVKTSNKKIGYIPGAGDKIPEALIAMGYEVTEIDIANSNFEDLMQFNTIVAGIRAYNTNEALQNQYEKLNDFMQAGGTYVVQYNTTYSLPEKDFFPFELELSRDRITDENATLTLLAPNHPILNYPNNIDKNDFNNWVQERGLYFPNSWGATYTPLLRGSDIGEDPTDGALLVADYGKGKFVYTGLSFFRELPSGVAGAYKLFSNIVSY